MAKQPSQERFVFDGQDKTPAHDALMLWIDKNIVEIVTEVLGLTEKPTIVLKIWEQPIRTKRGGLRAVADMHVRVRWGIRPPQERVIFVEAKPKIVSLGELIRQIRIGDTGDLTHFTTRTHLGDYIHPQWLIVSPDDRFAATLKEQGFLFFKSPKL